MATTTISKMSPFFLMRMISFTIFSISLHYLIGRWSKIIKSVMPVIDISYVELAATIVFFGSAIYLFRCIMGKLREIARSRSFYSTSKVGPVDEIDHAQMPLDVDHASPPLLSARLVDIDHASPPLSPGQMEIVASVVSGATPSYTLEVTLGDCKKAAEIRRHAVQIITAMSLDGLPLDGFDYDSIFGQCCEMPVGYIQIPVGIAGPLLLDGEQFMLPMATTEGCLVASTNRGCKAIALSGGASAIVLHDGMSRAPVVRFTTAKRAVELKLFLEIPENFNSVAEVFNSSSRFARLQKINCMLAGRNLYMRFTCSTGDAMGMNMVSKGVQNVLEFLKNKFLDMEVVSISGNVCADKKPAAINSILGRGKSVVCEAIIKEEVLTHVLKTSASALVELNLVKNLAGSAVGGAGSGGFNAHASNIVTAIFIATGQDPAQNVESSNCLTMLEAVNDGKDLHISVTMNSIEVGTIGGGTQVASQSACLNLLGIKGANTSSPGENSRKLATIISGAVLAGELSLMAALATGQLVNSHMKYNRSTKEACMQDDLKEKETGFNNVNRL